LNIKNQIVRIYGAGFTNGIARNSLMTQRSLPRDDRESMETITLGVFHGTVSGQMSDNNYNPISVKQIENNQFDYLALAHIHKQTEVLKAGMSNYAYCGCPEGLSFATRGIKGVYIGTVYHGYADMKYVPICKRIYDEIHINIEEYIEKNNSTDNVDRKYRSDNSVVFGKFIKHINNVLIKKYGDYYKENIYRLVLSGKVSEDIKSYIRQGNLRRELDHLFFVDIKDNTEIKSFHTGIYDSDIKDSDDNTKGNVNGKSFTIDRIHIGAFGGLKDFVQEYTAGFNLIYGENEYGKSTIMSFIRIMLYGCSSKSKDINQNIRKKYEPFSGEKMSGSLECSLNGVTYVIEKELGKTKGNDIRHIYNKNTGEEIILSKEVEAGKYFLGIDEAEFLKTMFDDNIGGYGSAGEKDKEMLWRIANLNAGLPEYEGDLKTRNDNIESLNKDIEKLSSKRGISGEIPELSKQIEEYRMEMMRLQEERRDLQDKDRENNYMETRERRILKELVDKMGELEESGQGDDGEYRIYRLKYILHFCITFFLVILSTYMFLCVNRHNVGKYAWRKGMLIILIVLSLIYLIKVIFDKRGLKRNKPYDYKLASRIEVIKEELGYEDYSIDDINKRIDEIDRHLSGGESAVDNRLNSRIEKCSERMNELIDKRNRLKIIYDDKLRKRDELIEELKSVREAMASPISERAVELLNFMTNDYYESILIDENYNMKVKKKGMATHKEWKHLSTATATQAYLALRISMCEMLGDNGVKVPILMDDVLNYCDEERSQRTIQVLKNLDRQVILLTCHSVKQYM
jgi:hypothetical protein